MGVEESTALRDTFTTLVYQKIKHCPEFKGSTHDPVLTTLPGIGDVYSFGGGIAARVRVQRQQPTLYQSFSLRYARESWGQTELQKLKAAGIRPDHRLLQVHAWLDEDSKTVTDCAVCRLGNLIPVASMGEKTESERGGRAAFLAIPWTEVPHVWILSMSDPEVYNIKIGSHNLWDATK